MDHGHEISGAGDKPLFTPGPLTTSRTVKQAMLRDLGSRDFAFIGVVRDIRSRLLELGGVASPAYEAVLMQGSGTFGIEACIASLTPPDGKWLVAVNGAYGKRFVKIAGKLGIQSVELEFAENRKVDPEAIDAALEKDPAITAVSCVHCETTTGILNPIGEIGKAVGGKGRRFFVDAMSSFGAVPVDLEAMGVDVLVSSANKCIEGVPGFSFVLVRRDLLEASKGWSRSVCFDLYDQWRGLEANGQFRFTPPTHAIAAFHQALLELETEGGVEGRGARYGNNYETLVAGMRAMGFQEYLRPEDQTFIITSFLYPESENFNFETFYEMLNDRGFVIYPGKVSDADCFRIGTIGRLFAADVKNLLAAVRSVLEEMRVDMPAAAKAGRA